MSRPPKNANLLKRAPYLGTSNFHLEGHNVGEGQHRAGLQMAESQLSELQNMRVFREEARLLSRNFAYYRRAKLEARLELVLGEVEQQIDELRADRS